MAERSFAREVEDLKLGAGDIFRGEGILAITKALLQSGVSYVGGYQGSPISHLMDVLADAKDVLDELGVHFETSASEATAAATLSASVMYPLRGAVTWKSTAGTNVAADALSNLSSGGVTGGALIIIGEDYGEGSSIMQERSHAYALKSQIWLLDPRPNLPTLVRMVEQGFALSEASNTPVMLEVRIRTCHVHGQFVAKDNQKPKFTLREALENPVRDVNRIVLPPASFSHEREKLERRGPAAIAFIKEHKLNEIFGPADGDVGIVMLGGMYNTTMRALQYLGLADAYGGSAIPLYVLNVAYPLIEDELVEFCAGKRAVLMVEEGAPDYIERDLNTILRRRDLQTKVSGKDVLPMGGEYTAPVLTKGVRQFLAVHARELLGNDPPHPRPVARARRPSGESARRGRAAATAGVLHRMPGAADLCRPETGRAGTRPASYLRGYRLPSILDPAAVQCRRHHHGLWPRARIGVRVQREVGQALDLDSRRWRILAQRPDLLDRQRRLQQARWRDADRRQLLLRRDRRAGHPVVSREQPSPQDQQQHRRRSARHWREMGASD